MKRLFVSVFILLSVSLFLYGFSKPNLTEEQIYAKAQELVFDKEVAWDVFENLAFGAEGYWTVEEREKLERIKKFDHSDQLLVDLMGDNLETYQPMIQEHIERLNTVLPFQLKLYNKDIDPPKVGVMFVFVDDIEDSINRRYRNFFEIVGEHFAKDPNYYKHAYQNLFGQGKVVENQETAWGTSMIYERMNVGPTVIWVRSDMGLKNAKAAIIEEFTQILGVSNDYADYPYSSFNNRYYVSDMTALDWFALKILYHPEIKAGMSKKKTRKVYDEIYDELIAEERKRFYV